MRIEDLTPADAGRWVQYTGNAGEIEKGRILRWTQQTVFVVYKCGGHWDRYQDFTAQGTNPEQLEFIADQLAAPAEPLPAKPKIYLFCHANGGGSGHVHGSTPGGDVVGYALCEDGVCLCSHLSSSPGYSKHDMGYTSTWKHEHYAEHYPGGYDLEWIDEDKLDGHAGFQEAKRKNEEINAAREMGPGPGTATTTPPPAGEEPI